MLRHRRVRRAKIDPDHRRGFRLRRQFQRELCVRGHQDAGHQMAKGLKKEYGGQSGGWAYTESPLVDGELVIATPGGDSATLVALKAGQSTRNIAAAWEPGLKTYRDRTQQILIYGPLLFERR